MMTAADRPAEGRRWGMTGVLWFIMEPTLGGGEPPGIASPGGLPARCRRGSLTPAASPDSLPRAVPRARCPVTL